MLKVKVDSVRVVNYQGKEKRIPTRRETGRRSDWKKAYVTIKSGEKPIMYEDAI
ncbi:MAG TPA: 50S ribosomal protein L23 [Blastocatellia bacterium]